MFHLPASEETLLAVKDAEEVTDGVETWQVHPLDKAERLDRPNLRIAGGPPRHHRPLCLWPLQLGFPQRGMVAHRSPGGKSEGGLEAGPRRRRPGGERGDRAALPTLLTVKEVEEVEGQGEEGRDGGDRGRTALPLSWEGVSDGCLGWASEVVRTPDLLICSQPLYH